MVGKAAFQQWELNNRISLWRNTLGLRYSDEKIVMILPIYTRKLLKLSRGDLRVIIGLLTEHCWYNFTLYRMGKSADKICRLYESEEEIAEHIVCS